MRVVQDHEFVGTLSAALNTFVVYDFSINPGLVESFPWLSKTALNWEQYRVHRLCYYFVPSVPTTQAGMVTLAPEYDASDSPPSNEFELANTRGSVTFPVWNSGKLILDVSSLMGSGPRRFVRESNVLGDIKTYDVGKLFVGFTDVNPSNTLGKLYVDYDIEFFVPQAGPAPGLSAVGTSLFFVENSVNFPSSGSDQTVPFPSWSYDPLKWSIGYDGSLRRYYPPPGTYNIDVKINFQCTVGYAGAIEGKILINGGIPKHPRDPSVPVPYMTEHEIATGAYSFQSLHFSCTLGVRRGDYVQVIIHNGSNQTITLVFEASWMRVTLA